MPNNVWTTHADGQTQVQNNVFIVVLDDAAEEKDVVRYIKHGGYCTRTLPRPTDTKNDTKGSTCTRSRTHTRTYTHYIVLDLPRFCTLEDVPYDEPRTAFSPENMARQFGHLWRGGGAHAASGTVRPEAWMPVLVTREWLKVAVRRYIAPWIIEARYVDRPSTYLARIKSKADGRSERVRD